MKTKQEVEKILDKYGIKKYTINADLSVDVDGDVYLSNQIFKKLPVNFGKVTGNFFCFNCIKLTSLKGAPKEVGGRFLCFNCDKIISLEGAPEKVGEDFNCSDCFNLISLKGSPKEIEKCFYCFRNPKLSSLQYAPLKCKIYDFERNILLGNNINKIEADKYLLRRILLGDFKYMNEISNKNKIKPLLVMRDFDLL